MEKAHGPSDFFVCPQCEAETPDLHEGYCVECCADNQRALDEHNAQYDAWKEITSDQRDSAIRDAVRAALP